MSRWVVTQSDVPLAEMWHEHGEGAQEAKAWSFSPIFVAPTREAAEECADRLNRVPDSPLYSIRRLYPLDPSDLPSIPTTEGTS